MKSPNNFSGLSVSAGPWARSRIGRNSMQAERRRRRPLPGYPFHGERYWIDPSVHARSLPPGVTRQMHNVNSAVPAAASCGIPARQS